MRRFYRYQTICFIFVFIIFVHKSWTYAETFVDDKNKLQFTLLSNDWKETPSPNPKFIHYRFLNIKNRSLIIVQTENPLLTEKQTLDKAARNWIDRVVTNNDWRHLKIESEGWTNIDSEDAYWIVYNFNIKDYKIKQKLYRILFNNKFYQFRLSSRYDNFSNVERDFENWIGSIKFLREDIERKTVETRSIKLTDWYNKQYALVVGIDKYKNVIIDELQNAVNDAKAVTNMFKQLGFEVKALYNEEATKSEMLNSFSRILTKTIRNDSFLFYFAGHGQGFTLENGERIGYILPYDANLHLSERNIVLYDTEAIPINTIKTYCKNMKAKHVALLFDSCFAGLAMKRGLTISQIMSIEYYNDLLKRKAINILTAGDDQPVSDGTGHSPFTRAIIEGLSKKALDINDRDGFATFSQLSVYVKEKVEKATGRRQRPQFDNLSIEDGDFIFKLR